jgi:hypothetical protein
MGGRVSVFAQSGDFWRSVNPIYPAYDRQDAVRTNKMAAYLQAKTGRSITIVVVEYICLLDGKVKFLCRTDRRDPCITVPTTSDGAQSGRRKASSWAAEGGRTSSRRHAGRVFDERRLSQIYTLTACRTLGLGSNALSSPSSASITLAKQ